MVKKQFTKPLQRKLNDLSDVELIEEMDNGIIGSGEVYRDVIKAILDKRLKKAIQSLDKNTARYSKVLIWLTSLLFVIAYIQTIVLLKTVSGSNWAWAILVILLTGIVWIAGRSYNKEFKNKN